MSNSVNSDPFLPYGRQSVDEEDIAAVAEVLRGDWLTTGPMVQRFEHAFAEKMNVPHAVCCNSGTAGLHLANLALGLGPGDLAIVPSVTFLATANAVRYTGAEVVFADVDGESGLLTEETFHAALARARTLEGSVRLVLPVHLKGSPVDLPAINAIATSAGISVVEDACHAIGTRYGNDAYVIGDCSHSSMAVFSTHPVKTMTTGEGGIVTTRDSGVAARLRRFRSHGMESDPAHMVDPGAALENGMALPWHYEMAEIGWNYRLPDFECALGLSQLNKLDRFIARRAELVARYDRLLQPLAPIVRPPHRPLGVNPSWHLYAVQIDFAATGVRRAELMRLLRSAGIGTQVHYIPVHTQPYYRQRYGTLSLPGAERYYANTLSLPLYPLMADGDVDRVVHTLGHLIQGGCV